MQVFSNTVTSATVLSTMLMISVLFYFFLPTISCAANILAVVPITVKSHSVLFHCLMEKLAIKGHNVTIMSNTLMSKNVSNLTQIHLPLKHDEALNLNNITMFDLRFNYPIKQIFVAMDFGVNVVANILSSSVMQNLLASNSTFDLVITQGMLVESILAGLSHRFQAPSIAISSLPPNLWCNFLVGNHPPSSYNAHPFLGLPTRMTFLQRTTNFFYENIATFYLYWFTLPKHQELLTKYFGPTPPLIDILMNTSLVMVNDHFSLTYPRPSTPQMISIAGAHVPPPKELPIALKNYLENAKHGVILFSMGSILKGSLINEEKIAIFLKVFSKLDQIVLWKYEKDLPGKPDNVLISKWLPQNDILAHPKLRLFITHGGILSTIEAAIHGVPVVGIPVFGDQPFNMKNVIHAGTGLAIDYDEINVDNLYTVIQEVLNNPKYRDAAQMRSKLLQDQPLAPTENFIWWIEHVIRHKGAQHLRLTAQDLKLYQQNQIDVIAFLLISILIIFWLTWKIIKYVLKLVRPRISEKTEKYE